MTVSSPDHMLADIRREIDQIDDGLVELLLRRWAKSARVRELKGGESHMATTPYRPAREAQIMRRLIAQADGVIPAADLWRLWRVILSASISAQATVSIHVDAATGSSVESRLLIAEHFCGMPVCVHSDIDASLAAAARNTVDLAIFDVAHPWADSFVPGRSSGLSVVAALPFIRPADHQPRLIVAARTGPEASGDDHTILLSRGALPADSRLSIGQHWLSGAWLVSAIGGPHQQVRDEVADLGRLAPDLQLCIAGVMPAPIEIQS